MVISLLPHITSAFEFEAGQRFCVTDNSFTCESVWEVESLGEEGKEIVLNQLRLLSMHKDNDLPVEKWASARNKDEYLLEWRSLYRFEPPSVTVKHRADPVRICEYDILSLKLDGLDTVKVQNEDGSISTQRIVDATRNQMLDSAKCFEISFCWQRVALARHERVFVRVFGEGEEQRESASFLQQISWFTRSKRALVPSHILLGNPNRQPAECG